MYPYLIFTLVLFLLFGCILFLHNRRVNFAELFTPTDLAQGVAKQYADLSDHRALMHIQRGDSGKIVLLLHNDPSTLDIWEPLYQIVQRYSLEGVKIPTLVSYDIRGHGTAWMPVDTRYADTDITNTAWTLQTFVDDCKAVYDQFIANYTDKIILVGFGFGGAIAQAFALDHPNLIEKLVILQTPVVRNDVIQQQVDYLAGPKGLIQSQPDITYLTMPEEYTHARVCEWFNLPPEYKCPADVTVRIPAVTAANTARDLYEDTVHDLNSPQFNLVVQMWRQGSASTMLQVSKLLLNTTLPERWRNTPINFPVHLLAARNDPSSTPEMMTNTFTIIQHANPTVVVVLDIVDGKHGFTIMRPDYIAGIISPEIRAAAPVERIVSSFARQVDHQGFF